MWNFESYFQSCDSIFWGFFFHLFSRFTPGSSRTDFVEKKIDNFLATGLILVHMASLNRTKNCALGGSPLGVTPSTPEPNFWNLYQNWLFSNGFQCFEILYRLKIFQPQEYPMRATRTLKTNYIQNWNKFSTTRPYLDLNVLLYRTR